MPKDLYAVIGNPIEHSLSPHIHTLFAKQTGEPIEYTAIQLALNDLETTLTHLQARGMKGLSVTLPFKEEAFHLTNTQSERARVAACINTIRFEADGKRYGDNTDGVGLLRDLTINHAIELTNKSILILGAGGATRNCLWPLLQANPACIILVNRTRASADILREHFKDDRLSVADFNLIPPVPFDVIINSTSASLQQVALPITTTLFHENSLYYDLMYGEKAKITQQAMQKLGISRCIDGLGMLVEQAAEQFYLWRGVMPTTKPVIEALLHHC